MSSIMFMRLVFILSITASAFFLSVLILRPAFYSKNKFINEVVKDSKSKKSSAKWSRRRKKFKRIVLDLFSPSEAKLKRIDKLLHDLRMTRSLDATDIIFDQYLSLLYVIGGILVMASPEILGLDVSYHLITGISGALLIYTGYKRWVNTEKKLQKELDTMEYHFERDLATLFNLFYSRLKENTSFPLLDMIDEVKPNATQQSKRVLNILAVDVKMQGEQDALTELSNRFKSPHITKMSNLLANRLRGIDNVVEMEEFIKKLRYHREFLMKDMLKEKDKKVENIKSQLMFPALMFIGLKLLAMVMQNLGKV